VTEREVLSEEILTLMRSDLCRFLHRHFLCWRAIMRIPFSAFLSVFIAAAMKSSGFDARPRNQTCSAQGSTGG
jgi:hypothetical protein